MKLNAPSFTWSLASVMILSAAMMVAGCQTSTKSDGQPTAPPTVPVAAKTDVSPAPVAPAAISFPLRIKAGINTPLKDAEGNTWLPEQGFVGGDTIDRGEDLKVGNTKAPELYRAEHYSMTAFSCPLPNGKYTVKLHFCEAFDGIQGPGQRVFSFNVEGHEFKDFDVWVKAGGPLKAYVETVNVGVTDGKLDITFTSNIENPQINAIEITPAS